MNYLTPIYVSALALIAATSTAFPRGESAIVLHAAGPNPLWLRVEAVNDDVVRVWYAGTNTFSRKASIALENVPTASMPLRVENVGRNIKVYTNNLMLLIDRSTLAIRVLDAKTKAPLIAPLRMENRNPDGKWTIVEGLAPDEHILGLGQDNRNRGKLDRRGTVRELWAGQQIKSGNVTADYPVPFMLSTGPRGHAYGVFFDNVYRLKYDLGKAKYEQINVDSEGGEADLYIINGPTPKNVVSRYTALTGRPSLPPLWALGYIQSRCVFYNWNDVDSAYEGLRSRGYPVDAMVIDYSWPEVMNDFVWDKRWTVGGVTPGDRVRAYRKKGVNFMMSISGPMLQKTSPTYAAGWAAGVFATDGKGKPVQAGYYDGDLLDFTAPKMNAWLWPQVRPRNLEGVDGWWLDLTEPEGEPAQTVYKGGKSPDIHNQYSMLVTRSYEGSLLSDHPNERPFILTRAGSAGIQRHHATLWTGDIHSDYPTLAAHPGEMLNSGLSGLNSWTCDTGGFLTGYYKGDQFGAHARLYERWMQFSVFSPVTRAHKAGLCMPYEFGLATEQGTKKYLNLRYRLLPYIYAHAFEASQTGIPLVRSMGLEFPSDPGSVSAAGDQYMFGDSLLVAPVLNEGVANRPVYFPPGKWVDWDYGYEYQGGRTWVVHAPQNRIPVVVRPGAIIPMAPNMANTMSGKWDPLTVEIFPSGTSNFTMVRDDGRTFDYTMGRTTQTRFISEDLSTAIRFQISATNQLFPVNRYDLHFHLDREPISVTTDGLASPWLWDKTSRILSTTVTSAGKLRHTVRIHLYSAKLSARPAPILVADKLDLEGEANSGGKPIPHFFPGPKLPAGIKAIDYDNGGEGVAYHIAHPPMSATPYRSDNAGIMTAPDLSYLLTGMQKDDWLRYSLDGGNGGYFDLVIRAQGHGRLRIISSDRNVIAPTEVPESAGWEEIVLPNVYLNPGLDSLMLFVEEPGFSLDSLNFRPAIKAPTIYPAGWAARTGQVVSTPTSTDIHGGLGNVGQLQGSVTLSITAVQPGSNHIRIRYANGGKEITLSLTVNGGTPTKVSFPNTGGGSTWKDLDLNLLLSAGANRFTLDWNTTTYDSIGVDRVEVVHP